MEAVKKYLYGRKEIIFAYLYGSLARESENILSDIDIAIYIDNDNIPYSGSFGCRSETVIFDNSEAGFDVETPGDLKLMRNKYSFYF